MNTWHDCGDEIEVNLQPDCIHFRPKTTLGVRYLESKIGLKLKSAHTGVYEVKKPALPWIPYALIIVVYELATAMWTWVLPN